MRQRDKPPCLKFLTRITHYFRGYKATTLVLVIFFLLLALFILVSARRKISIIETSYGNSLFGYGTGQLLLALPQPFLLHYVRFKPDDGQVEFRFIDYLSVMSGVLFLKPDEILLHGDFVPEGKYWDQLRRNNYIRHVFRNKDMLAQDGTLTPVDVEWPEHAADMAKLDVLLDYSGVAVDFDVFFVRGERIREILATKQTLLCFGDGDAYNVGFIASHAGSNMLKAWRRSYRDMYQPDWNFNQGVVPKYLAAVFREDVYVADKICNNPFPNRTYDLPNFFENLNLVNWTDSIAIHTYERHMYYPVQTPTDLEGPLTSHKELLRTVYFNLTLPARDLSFRDEIDPLTSQLK